MIQHMDLPQGLMPKQYCSSEIELYLHIDLTCMLSAHYLFLAFSQVQMSQNWMHTSTKLTFSGSKLVLGVLICDTPTKIYSSSEGVSSS